MKSNVPITLAAIAVAIAFLNAGISIGLILKDRQWQGRVDRGELIAAPTGEAQ